MGLLSDEIQFHVQLNESMVGKYAILPGDPGRVEKIAAFLDDAHFVASNREYTTYTGTLLGEKVSVVSTGIGGPSAAIAVEELIRCGVHTFIRVGTCGGINDKVRGGDVLIASAAVRSEGTSKEYLPEVYPAVADFEVVTALKQAGDSLSENEDGKRCFVGVVQSKDNFYGQVEPHTMPVSDMLTERWNAYVRCGCLASEMESAALFIVGQFLRVRVGSCFLVVANQERAKKGLPNKQAHDTDMAIKVSVEALKKLIIKDRELK